MKLSPRTDALKRQVVQTFGNFAKGNEYDDVTAALLKSHLDEVAVMERELNQWKEDAERLAIELQYLYNNWGQSREPDSVEEALQKHNDLLNPVKSPFGHFRVTSSDAMPAGTNTTPP